MRFFDVVVPKEFEVTKDGKIEKRTQWNKVGRVWPAKTPEVYHMELFLIPGQRYVIPMKENRQDSVPNCDELPF